MKTRFGTTLRSALALAALVAGASSQAAQTNDPVGKWDCTLNGAHGQRGLAFLTFLEVGTNRFFNGFQLLVASPPPSSSDPNAQRNPGGQETRTGFVADSGSGSSSSFTTVIGFGQVDGPWSYDSQGRIVGFFSQRVIVGGTVTNYETTCVSTQAFFITNSQLFVTNLSVCFDTATFTTNVTWTDPTNASATFTLNNTNFTVGPSTAEKTNQVSFVGKVGSSKRLTLTCSSSIGKTTYRGVKYNPSLKDLTGKWQAERKEDGQKFLELFSLTSFATNNPPFLGVSDDITNFPNIYWSTNGTGPGYSFLAISALSIHKQIGFVLNPTDADLRSSLGAFVSNKKITKANTKGIEFPDTPFRYNAFQEP